METETDPLAPGNSSVTEDTSGDTDCVDSSKPFGIWILPVALLSSSSSLKSESSCQGPLLANSWTFSHASCSSKSIKQLSTRCLQDFRCEYVLSNKGLWAHLISSTSLPFLFPSPFCKICRTVSLLLCLPHSSQIPLSSSPEWRQQSCPISYKKFSCHLWLLARYNLTMFY